MLLQTFQAVFADSFGKESYFIDPEIGCNIFRERNIFFAGGLFADLAVEMKMPVIVCIFVAAIMTQLVFGGGIFLNTMDNPFFLKCF